MPRSPGQSDFEVRRPPASMATDGSPASEASARATRWVMTLTWLVLGALFVLCAIGPHLPAGE